jgi:D-arginine dehydrogenase
MQHFDFLVVGGGISGAAAAYELASYGRVLLAEAEPTLGYHSTGRSAALFTPNFGNPLVRRLNAASHEFYAQPPDGFGEHPLLTPRGALTWTKPGEEAALAEVLAQGTDRHPIESIDRADALRMAPLVRPEMAGAAVYERGVMDMDVASTHQGFLKGLRRRKGEIRCSAPVTALRRVAGSWAAVVGGDCLRVGFIINAAGAWGDVIGRMAAARPVGLIPKRRTVIIVERPAGVETGMMPLVEFAGEGPYLRPEAGGIMASPADETPDEPHDVQPDDMDVAHLVDWLERHTTIVVRHAPKAWAGLRSFVPDGAPVVGFDPGVEGFFWLVGQGGYGIMMAPVLAQLAASIVTGVSGTPAIRAFDPGDLSPHRMQNAA